MRFELYKHWLTRQWRWRLRSANNRIIATSGESYINMADCIAGISLVKRSADAPVTGVPEK